MIGLIVAMDSEASLIKSLIEGGTEEKHGRALFYRGKLHQKEVVIHTCNIGKVSAAIGCVEMIHAYHPEGIINSGIAGGIGENVMQGDRILGQEVCYHDVWCGEGNKKGQVQGFPPCFMGHPEWLQKAEQLQIQDPCQTHRGLICSGDQFITTQEKTLEIRQNFPLALAVDMESGAIAQTCSLYEVPFLCCRLISDTPAQTPDHAHQYQNFWETASDRSFHFLAELIRKL